jgi:hypothetical protein
MSTDETPHNDLEALVRRTVENLQAGMSAASFTTPAGPVVVELHPLGHVTVTPPGGEPIAMEASWSTVASVLLEVLAAAHGPADEGDEPEQPSPEERAGEVTDAIALMEDLAVSLTCTARELRDLAHEITREDWRQVADRLRPMLR